MDGGQFEAGLERPGDAGPAGRLGERGDPGDLERVHEEQAHLHPDLRGHGEPGLPAHSGTVSDQNKEAPGQFPTLPRRQEVSDLVYMLRVVVGSCCWFSS